MVKENFIKVNTPEVVFEFFDDEVILINMESGFYYSVANVAANILEQIGDGSFVDDVAVRVADIYQGDGKEIEKVVHSFIEELLKENLIRYEDKNKEKIDTNKMHVTGEKQQKLNFELPVLNRYTDMQDLLKLDPIHEVDKSGWPNPLIDKPNSNK